MTMTVDQLMIGMAESAVRAGVLTLVAALALAAGRTRDAEVRSAVWTAVLAASLLMPVVLLVVPPVFVLPAATLAPIDTTLNWAGAFEREPAVLSTAAPIDWKQAARSTYFIVALFLLVRFALGLARGRHLRQQSGAVEELAAFGEVRESAHLTSPVTFGWLRPVIVLPLEWRSWQPKKLEAVMRHESAHIARADFLRQALASVHAAVFWFSPAAWWLRRELAVLAEQASDDRVLSEMGDPVFYAEVLFSFVARPYAMAQAAVPMARNGSSVTGERIERVLDETRPLSHAFGWAGRAGLVTLTAAALYATSAVSLAQAPPPAPPVPPRPGAVPAPPPVPPVPRPPQENITHRDHNESIEVSDTRIEYRRAGKRYRITDIELLNEARRLQAKQADQGRQQAALDAEQAALGRKHAELAQGHQRSPVDTSNLEAELDARLDQIRDTARRPAGDDPAALQKRLAELQTRLAELHVRMARRGTEETTFLADLNAQQQRLSTRQAELSERHAREAERMHHQLRELIESAIRDGRAKPVN